MKTINFTLALVLLMVYVPFFGQEDQSKNIKRVRIHDIYVQLGMLSEINSPGTLSDFKTLAPQSVLLANDLSGYSQQRNYSLNSNSAFSTMVGIEFKNKQRTNYRGNPLLKLGVSYYSGTIISGNLYQEQRKHYDTLVSNQTGQIYYLDSVTIKSYNMNYSSEQLRLDASLIFRTNPEARWSFYAGIGVTAGVSLRAYTDIFYSSYVYENSPLTNNYSYSYNPSNFKAELYKNKNNFGMSAFIPVGLDFRLGRKRNIWKKTHIFYELRPGMNMVSISELGTTITNITTQNSLGVRVSWH